MGACIGGPACMAGPPAFELSQIGKDKQSRVAQFWRRVISVEAQRAKACMVYGKVG